ncbi:MAG: cation:proton antiporter [Desulfobulbus sp.]|nr:cation:proton antiporter [Desulfobulbus sp.]
MHEYNLLEIMAAGFGLALIFGYLALRLKLSPIVGYLLAGFLVGPHSPGFVADMSLATQLSEAGVILLMFGVGLHFSLDDLFAVKGVALPGALLQSTAATAVGTWVAVSLGLSLPAGIMLGLGLAVASTVVLLRVLGDNNMIDTVHGHVSIGWLVVEDLLTVFVLVLLPSVAGLMGGAGGAASSDAVTVAKALGEAVLRLVALWVTVLVVGGRVVPWLLTHVVRTRSQELFTLTVLVAAFATAVGAAVFFQASMALGAFLGGMVIGKTKLSHQAGADILPLRDAFAVLFFLSVGMLFNPAFLLEQPLLIALCLVIVLLLKPLVALLVVTVIGYSTYTGLVVAISLAQVGEFSFILAQQAQYLGIIPESVYNVLVACALVSITVNPALFSAAPRLEAVLRKREKLWRFLNARAEARALKGNAAHAQGYGHGPGPDVPIAVVVGYGPTGKSVVGALSDQGVTPVVIDLNMDTVNRLSDKGMWTIFGDASRRDVLIAAGIERAGYLIITVPVAGDVAATAAMARSLNPDIRILARARFLEENKLLRKAGVSTIAFEEEEVAKSLTAMVLEDVRSCDDAPPADTKMVSSE